MHIVDENNVVFEVRLNGTYCEVEERSPSGVTRPATVYEVQAFDVRRRKAWAVVVKSLPIARAVLINAGLPDERALSDVGVPALARAWRGYDPSRGKWNSYAGMIVKSAAVQEHRKRAIKEPIIERPGEREDINVEYILKGLSEEDRLVLILRYWTNTSLEEIGAIIGLTSKSGGWLRVKRALERAREVVDEHGDV